MTVRIIPRLDIKGPNLVKGIHLEGLRVLGKPQNFARFYYEHGADELFFMDTVATLYGRNSLTSIIEQTAREIFIPLCIGGGLRTLDDIRTVLRCGADKVAVNTAALLRPDFIWEAVKMFGSSTIVVSIEAIRQTDGTYHCFTDNGREETGVDAVAWAVRAEELGAGELNVTSVDREGTRRGFDIELVRAISDRVDIPVIAHGGAGRPEHIRDVLSEGGADAVGIASILHYRARRSPDWPHEDFEGEGNIEFLKQSYGMQQTEGTTIEDIKAFLSAEGVDIRLAQRMGG